MDFTAKYCKEFDRVTKTLHVKLTKLILRPEKTQTVIVTAYINTLLKIMASYPHVPQSNNSTTYYFKNNHFTYLPQASNLPTCHKVTI